MVNDLSNSLNRDLSREAEEELSGGAAQ